MGLLERDSELLWIGRAVEDAAAGEGGTLVIEGEPGIGKTSLLDEAAERAESAGMSVLSARGGELEREFGFGVVRQLFEGVISEHPDVFAGQARFAARVLGMEVDEAPSMFPAIHGLYWMTLNLAEARPLALLVDDAQWADRPSLRFLAYLAPRLDELPILLAVTARAGEEADRLRHTLGRPRVLEPERLSAEATAQLIRSRHASADDDLCAACHVATGGNAFYVQEVAAAIGERGETPRPQDWSPEGVTHAVAGRIAALSPATREVARACAILGDGAAMHRIASLAGLGHEAAREAVDELRSGGILAPTPRIAFIHPIVRAAVEASIAPGLRASAHARAARLEAAANADAERIAVHLLATDPAEDQWACERLAEAAREAISRGAPEAAWSYLERALDEPPPEEDRSRLLLELGTAEVFAFRRGAAAHVRQGFELARAPDERLHAALLSAHLGLQGGRGVDALEPLTLVLAETSDERSRELIEGFIVNFTRSQLSARRAAQAVVDRLRESDVGADAQPAVLVAVSAELAMAGLQRERAVELAGAALDRLDQIPSLVRGFAELVATRVLIVADEHERARELIERSIEATRARGGLFDFTYQAVSRSNLNFRAGNVLESETDVRDPYELGREEGWPLGLPSIAHYLVQALVERGELDEAWNILRETGRDRPATELSDMYTTNLVLFARARLRLASGDAAETLTDLRELAVRQEALGEHNPALSPWRSEAALAHHQLGEGGAARALAAEEVELARRWGAPRGIGMALRAAGIVEGGAAGEALLREAVEVLGDSFALLEHGRALADLGDAVLARGDPAEARELLRQALELAHRCGAAALEERVVASLRAAGARPRRAVLRGPDALTPSERRVAELAASGLANREIAERLYVTDRTVEYHLHNAYRKLGIEKRTKLAGALGLTSAPRA